MGKYKEDKRVNKIVKKINRDLKKDVFGDRFWLRQIKKQRVDGLDYYLYEMKDRKDPRRDTPIRGWLWGGSQFLIGEFYEAINDFIIRSDFWSIYHNDPERYDKSIDYYLKER